jgi:lipid-A-disaccharide synthase
MSRGRRILISAGEASGDRLGAGLARALLRRRPDLELSGMGGPQMAAAGVRLVRDAAEVSVVGIQEVLAHLPAIRAAMRALEGCLDRERPDLLVPIDFPDFNLRLAARARRRNVDVVYFVSPQIWAWRRGRVRVVRDLVRRMLVLFPFETAFYEEAGVPVTFVGHPAAEAAEAPRPRETLCRLAGLDPRREIVALVPGSRRSEVRRLLPPLLAAAARVRERRPDAQALVTLAPALDRAEVQRIVASSAAPATRIHAGDFPEILSVCAAGAVASGTASLEAAVAGLPLVVVYRVSAVTAWIGRMLVRLDSIALPNLIAGRRVVPELVQGACNPGRIATELLRYLERPEEGERVRAGLAEIRDRLGGPGIFDRAAEAVLRELDAREA